LTTPEVATVIRLLRLVQTHLKSAVESSVLPGKKWPRERSLRPQIAQDRSDIKAARGLINKIERRVRRGPL